MSNEKNWRRIVLNSENPKIKKPSGIEGVANWFFGNFCARCGKFDRECENYGKNCWDKIQAVKNGLKESGREYITHKKFARIIRISPFCKPTKREFHECPICKAFGIPQRRW